MLENLIPETCCCIFQLETGATIIGVATLVVGVLLGVLGLGLVPSLKPADSSELTIEIVLVALAVIAGISLILAVKTQKRFLCWPYLVLQTLVIAVMIYQLVIAALALQETDLVKNTLAKIKENIGEIGEAEPAATGDVTPMLPKAVTTTTKRPTTQAGKTTLPLDPILGSIEDEIIVDFLKADPPAGFQDAQRGNSTSTGDISKEPPSDTRLVFEIARDAVLTGVFVYFLLVVYSFHRKLGYSVTSQKPEV